MPVTGKKNLRSSTIYHYYITYMPWAPSALKIEMTSFWLDLFYVQCVTPKHDFILKMSFMTDIFILNTIRFRGDPLYSV